MDHQIASAESTEHYCPVHTAACNVCGLDSAYGLDHLDTCITCDDRICEEHRVRSPILDEVVCVEDLAECSFCEQEYAPSELNNGRCVTCNRLSDDNQLIVPDEISNEFRKIKSSDNSVYVIIYGIRTLRPNQLIVLDQDSMTEVHRRSVGLIERIIGVMQ